MLRMETIQYNLPQSRIPQAGNSILPDLPKPLAPPLHPGTLQPIGPDQPAPLFPMVLIMQEVSAEREIEIPGEVRLVGHGLNVAGAGHYFANGGVALVGDVDIAGAI